MVNNDNLIPQIENKKPVELVQELKDEYEVPSFEEFMKTYEYYGMKHIFGRYSRGMDETHQQNRKYIYRQICNKYNEIKD